MRITPDIQAQVAAAIRDAESRTDGEVSAIVAPASDAYHDVVLHWALLVGLLPLAVAAAFPHLLAREAGLFAGWNEAPPLRLQLTLLLVETAALFLLARVVLGLPALRFRLIPPGTRARRVRRRAITLFQAGTEQRTATRTGVLLYLSLAERRAEIVADRSIHAKVPDERWGEAMAVLLERVATGQPGEGMALAIGKIGDVLADHFPYTGTDPNELPDRLILL